LYLSWIVFRWAWVIPAAIFHPVRNPEHRALCHLHICIVCAPSPWQLIQTPLNEVQPRLDDRVRHA
jgi:hypothetical protein